MVYDRAQQIMLPQTGYFLSPPRINLVSSLQNTVPGPIQPTVYPRAIQISLPFTGYPDVHANNNNTASAPNYLTYFNPSEINEKDYQIITYEELERMLPDPKPTVRVELGILPNGCAYAPKTATRENYLLFPSKLNYILYFTHHYFSRENLCRDQTFVSMLVNRLILPLEKLIKAPRLAALNTIIEEVERALINSKIVCIEDMGAGMLGVRRIDGYPCLSPSPDYSFSNCIDASYSTATTPNSYVSHPQIHYDQRLKSNTELIHKSDMIQAEINDLVNKTGSMEIISEKAVPNTNSGNDIHNSPSIHQIPSQTNQSSVVLQNQNPMIALPIDHDNSKNLNISQLTMNVQSDRSDMALWPHQQSIRQQTTHGNFTQSSNTELCPPSFTNYTPIIGFHPRTNFASGNVQPSELQNIAILPLRPAQLSHYFVGQPGYIQSNYPAHLGYPQVSSALPNFNLNMAAAFASMNGVPNPDAHTQQSTTAHPNLPSGYYTNQFLSGHTNHFNPTGISHHPISTGLVATNQYQVAAIAAMAAASQQQQTGTNPHYIHPHNIPQTHSLQSTAPIYYAAQQYPLQTSIPRHPVPRLQPNATCPMQTYSYQSIPIAQNSDPVEPTCKTGLTYSTNALQTPNFAYPLLLQPQPMQLQPVNKSSTLSNLAAAGLQIHCPQSTRPYGIAHIPLNLTIINSASVTNNNVTSPSIYHAKSLSAMPTFVTEHKPLMKSAKFNEVTSNKHDISEMNAYTPPVAPTSPGSSSGKTGSLVASSNNSSVCFNMSGSANGNPNPNSSSKQQPYSDKIFSGFIDDSEDSTSSGIGEMTTASIGEDEKRTISSGTLTDQSQVKSTYQSSLHYEEN